MMSELLIFTSLRKRLFSCYLLIARMECFSYHSPIWNHGLFVLPLNSTANILHLWVKGSAARTPAPSFPLPTFRLTLYINNQQIEFLVLTYSDYFNNKWMRWVSSLSGLCHMSTP